ncbi:hypothetical protein FRC12_001068 [Ceratobasidium sp. 428]|nr:hypothetical protein FRC09_007616 [Ceratobasidium sp. 395]KAG8776154.1 hypothetical protein FRC12_001068 [Ceratobasidium sp. 428]
MSSSHLPMPSSPPPINFEPSFSSNNSPTLAPAVSAVDLEPDDFSSLSSLDPTVNSSGIANVARLAPAPGLSLRDLFIYESMKRIHSERTAPNVCHYMDPLTNQECGASYNGRKALRDHMHDIHSVAEQRAVVAGVIDHCQASQLPTGWVMPAEVISLARLFPVTTIATRSSTSDEFPCPYIDPLTKLVCPKAFSSDPQLNFHLRRAHYSQEARAVSAGVIRRDQACLLGDDWEFGDITKLTSL